MVICTCTREHQQRRVVLTGGPGAGKTAFLELVRQSLCQHVTVLPESASLLFNGGFPRHEETQCRRAVQRAIYHVQRELEVVAETHRPALVICDRGSIDGLAYWPGPTEDFWAQLATTREAELARYDAIIHLRTPSAEGGYNHRNPQRTESAAEAAEIDERILAVWAGHPGLHVIEPSLFYLEKAAHALEVLRSLLPECCTGHLPETGPTLQL
ncbi:MAG TPA: ATP-binding protein [Nocardioides sp.]|uniref:ATP/GTP-binding protein n=1 Tax=Nocardioides sp. TaxID=35761 RepID=UPI002C46AD32|nr:ATP-binding protein [Nocardioides sp.]HQR25711.1 ATP-binding protein [Nocardioides sp.]